MSYAVRFILRSILCIAATAAGAMGQTGATLDFGVRGGAFFTQPPIDASSNHYYPPAFTTDTIPYSIGSSVGVLLRDRIEIRFETVRSRFRYNERSTFPSPGETYVSTTSGVIWQFPLLATYRFGRGPLRPFAGGGIGMATHISGTSTATITHSAPLTPGVVVLTSPFRPPQQPSVYYIAGGLEHRTSLLSIRSELRYARWSDYYGNDYAPLNTRNPVEFLLGVSIHPFGSR